MLLIPELVFDGEEPMSGWNENAPTVEYNSSNNDAAAINISRVKSTYNYQLAVVGVYQTIFSCFGGG